MIKVKKDLAKIPQCLENGKVYNCDDVKIELKEIYNNKCCYCETKLTKNYEIEHFRPQSEYKWLEKSWSNLLLVCSSCNKSKGNRFEVSKKKILANIANVNVHNSASYLNKEEQQLLLHPEYDELEKFIKFEKGGKILSVNNNERAKYTIHLTKLDHADLNEARYEILKDFIDKSKNRIEKKEIKTKIIEFTTDAYNTKLEFSAYRKYIVKYHLKEILKDIFKEN